MPDPVVRGRKGFLKERHLKSEKPGANHLRTGQRIIICQGPEDRSLEVLRNYQ